MGLELLHKNTILKTAAVINSVYCNLKAPSPEVF